MKKTKAHKIIKLKTKIKMKTENIKIKSFQNINKYYNST